MIRRILALAAVGTLALSGVAWAVTSGKYSGKSNLTISGIHVTHPFGVTVRHGKVVNLRLLAASNCGALDGMSGIKSHFKINSHNSFSGTLKVTGFVLKIKGTFKAKVVTGSFTGTAKGVSSSCPVPKNTFKATLSG